MWPLLLMFLAVSLLWIPVLLFFFRNWRERKNPISLAICSVLFFVIYSDALVWAGLLGQTKIPLYIMQATEVATIAFFYLAIRWAEKKFETRPDPRHPKG